MLDRRRHDENTDTVRVELSDLLPAQARGLIFEAGGKRLIDGIDLTLGPGALTVVMGPNGAGKSLLLRLMHGMLTPGAGEVLWGGRPLDESIRKRQAMVFQHPVLLRRSVAANIDFVLKLRGGAVKERRARYLGLAGLDAHADQPARLLSGGERQRLAMVRALAIEPDVLFMDEATASLDPASVFAIEDLVRRAREAGMKIIFVTHDLGQARRLADDVVFLHRGKVVEHSTATRFFDRPVSREAQDYVAGRIVL